MNNFSPSTDTSVGTKRFTAQEVQLAYTICISSNSNRGNDSL